MTPRRCWQRILSGAWLLLSLALLFACARPEPPGGGPRDEVAPWLVAASPDSGSVGHGPVRVLEFGFSEKMKREEAYRWLETFPPRVVASTSWSGARIARVELEEPLPADTVVVVEIAPGMRDAHEVPQPEGRRWVFATGDSIADGALAGTLMLEDEPLATGVVEIVAARPESIRVAQRPVLRRAATDSSGAWRLAWLSASGEPWLLRAYDDRNRDLRAGENEAQRLWPDTLRLRPEKPMRDLGLRVVYQPSTPGTLRGRLVEPPFVDAPVLAYPTTIAEDDTGFVPAPQPPRAGPAQAVPDTGRFTIVDAGPGLVRALFFADVDGDSLFSAVGDTADSVWTLEPWALVDSVAVDPGLTTGLPAPTWTDTLTTWPAPQVARTDTLAATVADSLRAAAADTAATDTVATDTAATDTAAADTTTAAGAATQEAQ